MTDSHASRRWERVKQAVGDAIPLGAKERASLLARLAAEDPGLAEEVASLLDGHDHAGTFMAGATCWEPDDAGGPHQDPEAAGESPLPDTIGRYRVTGLLGRGGMGEVYRAHDPSLQRDVALKRLPADLGSHPVRRARLLREARAAASLNHPGITTIHEIGESDGRDYIAFELVEGRTLHAILREGPLGADALADIAVPLADALAYAHERGVIHRDIKAANVMVTARGQPKLVDFGLAKLTTPHGAGDGDGAGRSGGAGTSADGAPAGVHDDGDTLSVGGRIFGTPAAMSPEQAAGRSVDARSDVFSFGSLLYEMATGRPAFRGPTAAAVMDAVLHAAPEPLAALRPDLSREFAALVERAMHKDPASRFQRIADLAEALRAVRFAKGDGRSGGAARRRPVRAAGVRIGGAALLLLALAAAWWAWRSAASPGPLTAVMSFEDLGDPEDVDQLGSMLAWRLTSNLAAADGVPVLSQQRLHDVARHEGFEDGRIERASATAVARAAGVSTMILGQVTHADGGLLATAELVDVASGRTLGAPSARGAGPADVLGMADELARQVRAVLRTPDISASERRALAQQVTSKVEAWRAYVRGETLLRGRRLTEATAAFEEAVDIDPAFALAHFRHFMALVWTGDEQAAERTLERALAFREKLPPTLRALLDAMRPYLLEDRAGEALPDLLEVIEEDPYQQDALFMLGEIYTHSALQNNARRAAEMYERLLAMDPDLSLVYERALLAYLRIGLRDRARERLDDWRERVPDVAAGLEGIVSLWSGRLDEASARLEDTLWPDLLSEHLDSDAVTAITARPLADLVAGVQAREGVSRVLALNERAAVLASVGRFEDAVILCRMAADVPPRPESPDGFGSSVRSLAQHKLAFLLALHGDAAGARAAAEAPLARQPDSPRCVYTALLFAARARDLAAVHRHVRHLNALVRRGITPSTELYRDAAAAELALLEGDAASARDGYRAVVGSGRLMEDWSAYEDSAGPLFRDGLARACLAAGDVAGAGRALDELIGCGYERARHPVLWVSALAARGAMQLDAGREAGGRELLQRVLAHWGAADWELPVVAEARARLAR